MYARLKNPSDIRALLMRTKSRLGSFQVRKPFVIMVNSPALKRFSSSAHALQQWYKSFMQAFLTRLAERWVIDRPGLALLAVAALTISMATFLPDFQLDASADSLLLEDDVDLRYYSGVVARYGAENYLIVTYTAADDLFAAATLANLRGLRDALLDLERVSDVISILDVPLIDSPRQSLGSLQQRIPTLEDPATDRELARREFASSPVYSNFLVSPDGRTTGLLIRFRSDAAFVELQQQRNRLREQQLAGALTGAELQELERLSAAIQLQRRELLAQEQADVARVRAIITEYNQAAMLTIGGMPLIVSDMIDYIRSDISVFGVAIAVILVVLLIAIFARVRWVMIALLCCAISVIFMSGLLGLLRWPVTVVSANFVALLLIFSLSLTVHLIQRYRELHAERPSAGQRELVLATVQDKFTPCVFTAITTIVGFASLLVSGIRPVIDFGWMMVIGLVVVLVSALLVFPACLMLLQPGRAASAWQARSGYYHGLKSLRVRTATRNGHDRRRARVACRFRPGAIAGGKPLYRLLQDGYRYLSGHGDD